LKTLTIPQAAKQSNLAEETIRSAVKKGNIKAEAKIRGTKQSYWEIDPESFAEWLAKKEIGRQVKKITVELPIDLIKSIHTLSQSNGMYIAKTIKGILIKYFTEDILMFGKYKKAEVELISDTEKQLFNDQTRCSICKRWLEQSGLTQYVEEIRDQEAIGKGIVGFWICRGCFEKSKTTRELKINGK
jgi:hypothetical protein